MPAGPTGNNSGGFLFSNISIAGKSICRAISMDLLNLRNVEIVKILDSSHLKLTYLF